MTLEFMVWFGLALMGREEKDSVLVNYELQRWNYKLLPEFTMNLDLLKFLRHCSNPTLIIWIYRIFAASWQKAVTNIIHSYLNIEKYVHPLLANYTRKRFQLVWQLYWNLKSRKYAFKLSTIQNAKFTQNTFLEQERWDIFRLSRRGHSLPFFLLYLHFTPSPILF